MTQLDIVRQEIKSIADLKAVGDSTCYDCKKNIALAKKLVGIGYNIRVIMTDYHVIGVDVQ